MIAGQQADPEALVEALGDRGRQRRARAEVARAGDAQRLDGGHAHQRPEQAGVAREEVDVLLAQQLGDPLGRDLVLEEQRRAVGQVGQQAKIEAIAVAHRRRELDHRRVDVGQSGDRRALVEAAGEQRALQAAPVLRYELGRRAGPHDRGWSHRCRVGVERRAGGGLPRLAATGTGDERAQRRALEHHLQLAISRRRVERNDHGADLGQRQRQNHEVGDVTQHEPHPRPGSDPHGMKLLRAPVDAV